MFDETGEAANAIAFEGVKASFNLRVTHAELALLELTCSVARRLSDAGPTALGSIPFYDQLDPAFRLAFPPVPGRPFEAFLSLLCLPIDPGWEHISSLLQAYTTMFDDDPSCIRFRLLRRYDDGTALVAFDGNDFQCEMAALVIFHVCKSALPMCFIHVEECRTGGVLSLGGGVTTITTAGVSTYDFEDMVNPAAYAGQA